MCVVAHTLKHILRRKKLNILVLYKNIFIQIRNHSTETFTKAQDREKILMIHPGKATENISLFFVVVIVLFLHSLLCF